MDLGARWQDAAGRNSFAAWLNAQVGGTEEETTLTGPVGLARSVTEIFPLLGAAGGLILAVLFVSGVVELVRGHLGGLALVLGPVALALFFVALMIAGRRSLDGKISKLIAEINAILGSIEMS